MTSASPVRRIPSELIEVLTQYESPNVFNPWRQADPMDNPAGYEVGGASLFRKGLKDLLASPLFCASPSGPEARHGQG